MKRRIMRGRLPVLVFLGVLFFAVGAARAEETETCLPPDFLPLCQSLAKGQDLPLPLGFSLIGYLQYQDYELKRMTLSIPGMDISQTAGLEIDNRVMEGNLKLDVWLLPFLNVFGLIGTVDGRTRIEHPLLPNEIVIDYDGPVFGGGGTAAAGIKPFFGSVTFTYTATSLSAEDSSVVAWIVTPKAGINLDGFRPEQRFSFWVGAMYQDTDEKHTGSISITGMGTIDYDVDLKDTDPWNCLAGMCMALNEHWDIELEGGLWTRQQALASVTYRF